ncbi:MAG: metallophosphoesterase [candidate division WOR-3 bacterium]|nr:metallophosphoesterase [candidate division WOR-3 bacterium]
MISKSIVRIGVIADSHDRLDYLKKAINILKDRDISTLIHLGDYISPFTIPLLEINKVYGVFGNNDGDRLLLREEAKKLGFSILRGPQSMEIGGRRIAIMHEPRGLESFRKSGLYDVVLYGHTHKLDKKNDPLTVNPGELCGYLTGNGTFVIIDLTTLTCEFISI